MNKNRSKQYNEIINHNYTEFIRPELGEKLKALGLDWIFTHAQDKYLYATIDGEERKVLDLVGGYGTLLFGHNNEEIWNTINDFRSKKSPNMVQMSIRKPAAQLAQNLNSILSNEIHSHYVSTFMNSGAEAVEFAIKHAAYVAKLSIEKIKKDISSALSEIKHLASNSKIEISNQPESVFSNYNDFYRWLHSQNDLALSKFKPSVLVNKGSYHGKTITALNLTSNEYFNSSISILPSIKTVDLDEDVEHINEIILKEEIEILVPRINTKGQIKLESATINNIIACIIEPIIGEGGVRPMDKKYLTALSKILRNHKVPFIADEIQSGFFRCGHLSFLGAQNIFADYLLIGKAISGGLCKIAICAIARNHYQPSMSMMHSSTFAEDELSCYVALKSLEIGIRHSANIAHSGLLWLEKLNRLVSEFPDIIKEVRGHGLMIGIEIYDFYLDGSFGFQILSRSRYLGYLISSFLLHHHLIRISITLSDPHTIRIHGNIFNDEDDILLLVNGLRNVFNILRDRDLYYLMAHLLPSPYHSLRKQASFELPLLPLEIDEADEEVAFIVHYISMDTVKICEPSIAILPNDIIAELLGTICQLNNCAILGKRIISNAYGKKTRVTFIGLPYTTEMVRQRLEVSRSGLDEYRKYCNQAIKFCLDMGINKIGLGQFNSILMRNGKEVNYEDALITTGNSLTIYAAFASVRKHLYDNKNNTIAVIGAGGNIALTLSEMVLHLSQKMIIIGSSESAMNKINEHVNFLINKNSHKNVIGSWDISLIKEADIVIIATSASSAFLNKSHFKNSSLVVDLSIPCNCDDSVMQSSDISFINGGMIRLPNHENLDILGIPLLKGTSYACLAETILMGMENLQNSYSFGNIKVNDVKNIGLIAEKNGFGVL